MVSRPYLQVANFKFTKIADVLLIMCLNAVDDEPFFVPSRLALRAIPVKLVDIAGATFPL